MENVVARSILERLTGKKFESVAPSLVVRFNEGLSLLHYKNGKTTLRYRGKTFDVTKRFNKIAGD